MGAVGVKCFTGMERGKEWRALCPHMNKCSRRTCANLQEELWVCQVSGVLTHGVKKPECVSSIILFPGQSAGLEDGTSACPHFLLMWGEKEAR